MNRLKEKRKCQRRKGNGKTSLEANDPRVNNLLVVVAVFVAAAAAAAAYTHTHLHKLNRRASDATHSSIFFAHDLHIHTGNKKKKNNASIHTDTCLLINVR